MLVAGVEGVSKHPCGKSDRFVDVETMTSDNLCGRCDCMGASCSQLSSLLGK